MHPPSPSLRPVFRWLTLVLLALLAAQTAALAQGEADRRSLAASAQTTDQLLLNPGFEEGSARWDVEGDGGIVEVDPRGGSRAMRLELGGAFSNQSLDLSPGSTYALTAWGKLDGAIDLGLIGVVYRDKNGERLEDLEPPELEFIRTEYVEKRLVFTVPAGVATVSVSAWKNDGPAAFLVDDFSLVPDSSPEPEATPPPVTCQRLMAPAYFYPPTGLWDAMIEQGSALGFIILNPNNGVHTEREWRYDAPIAKARAARIKVAGYIETDYGARSPAAVIQEMDRYREWYGVTSFFLDEADIGPESLERYRVMADHAHALGGIVILNFGFPPHPGYLAFADYVVTFEDAANVYAEFELPAWVREFPAYRFIQMVYGVEEDRIDAVLAKTRASNAGFVWITDDHIRTGSPYDSLPSYWQPFNARMWTDCAPG